MRLELLDLDPASRKAWGRDGFIAGEQQVMRQPQGGHGATPQAFFRHEVQTFSRLGAPATTARTRWMFGFHRRLVFFFDQGTLWPKPGRLAQMSHTAATGNSLIAWDQVPTGTVKQYPRGLRVA